jgi:hypothetical protein
MIPFIKRFHVLSFLIIGLAIFLFASCKKAEPDPYGEGLPASMLTTTPAPDTTSSFNASVNSGPILTFSPSKNTVGSNTNLIGTSTSYTITLTLPSSTTPGSNYQIGGVGGKITALLVSGSNHYVTEGFYGGGFLTIDSISAKGKYYGSFSFDAEDTVSNTFLNVSQGSFYHL